MKTAFTAVATLLLFAWMGASAQPQPQGQPAAPQPQQVAAQSVNLNAVLTQLQQATSSANVDIGKLRVERWKTDADQRQQLQHIAESLQKSISTAVPALVSDVQSSRGAVSSSFKLYHTLNVIYENLNYLADVAGGLGKKEEFDPLAADCAALEQARQNLSSYIEQSAGRLEAAARQPAQVQNAQTQVPGKKVVVINEDEKPAKKTVKPAKKKAATPSSATPASTAAQSTAAPH
jgi:hypothetical protein